MSDYHQQGTVTTLHGLYEAFDRDEYLVKLECKLEEYSRQRRISLLLPCLFSEVQAPDVLDRISCDIQKVRYLHRVVIALGGTAEEKDFREAREYFQQLRTPDRDVKLVWVLGPRVQRIFHEIEQRQIPTGMHGKGQSVWISLGYIFARRDCDVIALHDCDIVTYDRILLGRLVEPIANPNNDFEFCKGYYARISPSERAMKGRVTRLFVLPFLDTMTQVMAARQMNHLVDFFRYHRSFKYPLAGEFSLAAQLARGMNIAYDWGLEVSTLSEVYHRIMPRKIAQIDLASNYDHKHQELSPQDAGRGLHRMVVDIAKFYFSYLVSHGIPLDEPFVHMVQETYFQNALRFIKVYSDDAEVNDLVFDRYEEELMARHFQEFLEKAWKENRAESGESLIPSWNRVLYSFPDLYASLAQAVESDNLE